MRKKKEPQDYIDGFTDLIVPTNADAFKTRLFAMILRELTPRRVALFSIDDDEAHFVAATSNNQASVDRVRRVWCAAQATLRAGATYTEAAGTVSTRQCPLVVMPVCAPKLVGLLSVELDRPAKPEDLELLKQLRRVAAIALRAPRKEPLLAVSKADDYLRESTEDEILRDKMLIELHANEWNIAVVSRRLGVTRRTIYLRLARFGIKRLHVPKVPPKKRAVESS